MRIDAWRSPEARAGEDCGFARTASAAQFAAAEIWCSGLCDRARDGAEAQDEQRGLRRAAIRCGLRELPQWLAGTQLEQRVSLEDYSVSNRGLRSGLWGLRSRLAERVAQFEAVGVDLLLLQFSPQLEQMERCGDCNSARRRHRRWPNTPAE